MTPTVGVVIPTFERIDETVAAVASVLVQTMPASRVVVVDDGSSSSTVEALDDALRQLPGASIVELERAPHTGHPGRARNLGVRRLETEWVAFLDSDDVWRPDKLERQLARATAGVVAMSSNARRIVEGRALGLVLEQPSTDTTLRLGSLVKVNSIINSSVLIRRSTLAQVGGVASSYLVRGCEDYATWLRVTTDAEWLFLSEPLVDYTDEPSASIRGAEEFSIHPGQQAAWLDYVIWRRESGRALPLAERVLSKGLRAALLLAARAGSRS